MTRIKTIGFSLKAFSAKLQGLPLSYRIAGSGFLLAVVLLNILLTAGCLPSTGGNTGAIVVDGFELREFEMEQVSFVPQNLSSSIPEIHPASVYWLKLGDAIAPRWETHEMHWVRNGAMCGFLENGSDGDCQVCDVCHPPSPTTGPPCMGVNPVYAPGVLEVVAEPGFLPTDNPQQVLGYEFRGGDVSNACANSTQGPLSFFQPATSGLYRLRSNQKMIFTGDMKDGIKLHVVGMGAGLEQQAAYELMRQTVDQKDYWTWTIQGDPWQENFSPNLRVTDIRIFKGECVPDPTQGKQCAIPDYKMFVKPSRILFLPDFTGSVSMHGEESQRRCYSGPDPQNDEIDGNFINLYSCRPECAADSMTGTCTSTQTIRKNATPAYDPIPTSADADRAKRRQTWLVEFNTAEGADAVTANDSLIIEFTIRAN
jgi:hypothetical protein